MAVRRVATLETGRAFRLNRRDATAFVVWMLLPWLKQSHGYLHRVAPRPTKY